MPRHYLAILLVAFLLPRPLLAQPLPARGTDEALEKELADRVKELEDAMLGLSGDVAGMTEAIKKLKKIEKRNADWIKAVVEKHGWPGENLVGLSGESNAWLLVMHADHEQAFQKRCIELLKKPGPAGLMGGRQRGQYLAFLTDQVRLREGKKQLYGSRLTEKDGSVIPLPIEDEANVDKRRQEIGLNSLAESIEAYRRLQKEYSIQPK
jgi:hypothetical protein